MNEITMNKESIDYKKIRIEYIDIFRAIGIILMIMGHIGFGDKFDYFIHAFHMPMFFVISGYFFHKTNDTKKFLIKKIKTLLIPYSSFGIIFYIIWLVLHSNNMSIQPLVNLFSINTDQLPIAGALWFLTALFFTEIIYYFIDKIKIKRIKVAIVILIALLGNIITGILPFRLPFALDAAFTGIGLFYIGHLLQEFKDNKIINILLNLKNIYLLIIIAITVLLIFINNYINMRLGIYGIIPLFWINVTLSTIVLFNLSKKIDKILNLKIKAFIMNIGKDSIVYLCLNQFVILILQKIFSFFIGNSSINNIQKLIISSFELVITLLILYVLNVIIQNTKIKILIGK